MKRMKWRNPIPRPVRACLLAVLVIILALAYYIAIGAPTLSFRQEFRRAEKANLVGPSKIVDQLNDEYNEFDRMIVGETENGICFFGRWDRNTGVSRPKDDIAYLFSYREKTGDITVLAAPNIYGVFWDTYGASLPVYVFDDYPNATRAELTLSITVKYTEKITGETVTRSFTETFQSEADRSGEGFFRFWLQADAGRGGKALALLSQLSSSEAMYAGENSDAIIPGTIRLYDVEGNVILEKDFEVCSVATQAHK